MRNNICKWGSRNATALFTLLLLTGLAGCIPAPEPPPPVVPNLSPGEVRQDTLDPGQTSTLQMAVKARTFYAVRFSASSGFNAAATITGSPLPEPVIVSLSPLGSLSTAPQQTFFTISDGDLQIVIGNTAADVGGLLGGGTITTTLRIDELGPEDHGQAPGEATAIVPDGETLRGNLAFSDTLDYFTLPVQLGDLFNVRVEATRNAILATTNIDSFGQFNFNVPTNAGNQLTMIAQPGLPAAGQFSIIAAEGDGQVLLALRAPDGLLAPTPAIEDFPIEYALTVERVTSQQLQAGETRSGHIDGGFTAQYFIDVPSALSNLRATLSGPDGLVVYVRRVQPASFESFDFYLVLGGGATTGMLEVNPPQIRADRYHLTVDNILNQPSDYILTVEIN